MRNDIIAYIAFFLSAAVYGLLIAGLVGLVPEGGLAQLPQMLYALGWQAKCYALFLLALGAFFLTVGILFSGHRK